MNWGGTVLTGNHRIIGLTGSHSDVSKGTYPLAVVCFAISPPVVSCLVRSNRRHYYIQIDK